ncbi:hypothetical protein AT258_24075 [Bacillus wiedmannii]|nr:hypothetical protein AT258_24075 [Bacillus wiedmannii]
MQKRELNTIKRHKDRIENDRIERKIGVLKQEIKKVFEHTSVVKTNVENINNSLAELQSVTE